MPTVMLAEDLNVTLPLTYWVTDTEQTPQSHNKVAKEKGRFSADPPKLIRVTDKHLIWPMNTEYEIFSVKGKRHTLGAFFILNHKTSLKLKTPPLKPIVEFARKEGAIIDLDKHNWPWSMVLIPQMKVDLFELTNNHVWRTNFLFADWYKEYADPYMNLELNEFGFDELNWLKFGFANYYALLNCGFEIMPSAGTATGVHPVPAGAAVMVHWRRGPDQHRARLHLCLCNLAGADRGGGTAVAPIGRA